MHPRRKPRGGRAIRVFVAHSWSARSHPIPAGALAGVGKPHLSAGWAVIGAKNTAQVARKIHLKAEKIWHIFRR